MTIASDVYTDFLARIEAVLPTHKRLPKPYRIEENSEQFLDQGFAIQIGPGVNTQRLLSCQVSIRREFIVILTRKFIASELSRLPKQVVELNLLEDQRLITRDLESDPTLGSTNVANSGYVSDTGVSFVFTERENVLRLNSVFFCEYLEDLN